MRISITLAILASFALFFSSCSITLAQISTPSAQVDPDKIGVDELITEINDPGALEVGESVIAPNSSLYFLKALREKLEIYFAGNNTIKANRQLEFSVRRLREVNSLIKNKKEDLIIPAMEEYNSNLDQAISLANNKEDLLVNIGEAISRHLYVLQAVFDKIENPRAKIAVRAALIRAEEKNNKLLGRLSVVSQQSLIKKIATRQAFACKFLIREATSSALNDSEREVLKQKVADCHQAVGKNLKDELQDIHRQRMRTVPSQ